MSQYCKFRYGVPSDIGRIVEYDGRTGVIYKDGGHYVSVNFDDTKPGKCYNIYPKDENLKYLGMGKIRKMSASQLRYKQYIDCEYSGTFKEFLGIKLQRLR